MGSLFRSEDMILCQMYIPAESVFNSVAELGELGVAQFRDLKSNVNIFQRPFVNEIRRCEEVERQLRFIENELKKAEIEPVETFTSTTPQPREILDLEQLLEEAEKDLRGQNTAADKFAEQYVAAKEELYVLQYSAEFFEQASHEMELGYYPPSEISTDTGAGESSTVTSGPVLQLMYLAGVIPMTRIEGFSRLLYIASRGNIYFRHYVIDEPIMDLATGEKVHKAVFMIVFQGEQLKSRLEKVCQGYRAHTYDSIETRAERMPKVRDMLAEHELVQQKAHEYRDRTLTQLAANVCEWNVKVIKLKAIYHTLNMFHYEGQNFLCEAWLPYAELGHVRGVLERASEASGNHVVSLVQPVEAAVLPTYHRTNKFTLAFQAIIDSYGIANYKEVNPAIFSIITFPFLFSVMFGDAGHALIMLIFAICMILNENKLRSVAEKSEMFEIIFAGRYIVLMMGLFSVYSGLIYNDVFSKSLNIFGSKWHCVYDNSTIHNNKDLQLDPANTSVYGRSPYEFGVDPVWQLSMNKITFTNSFKKKISVIFGVAQMTLGVILSLCNHVYFKKPLNIICEFVPQIIFLMVIFGYLCALIFAKWLIYYDGAAYYNCAPNILIDFINMFMMSYPEPRQGCKASMYPGQRIVQTIFVVLAVICALWMLLTKPLYLLYKHSKQQHSHQLLHEAADGHDNHAAHDTHDTHDAGESNEHPGGDQGRQLLQDDAHTTVTVDPSLDIEPPMANGAIHNYTKPVTHEEPFEVGEAFIHQAIHTIEFCLGCISHTASYLRLWALSLAHAQLSEVLWSMVMNKGLTLTDEKYILGVVIYVFFTPFAVLTVAILLFMEGLSAFLHTLRLHWVEFNSKFYMGDGMAFEPFSYAAILRNRREN